MESILARKPQSKEPWPTFLLCGLFVFIAAGLSPENTYKMLENKVSKKARDSKRKNIVEEKMIRHCLLQSYHFARVPTEKMFGWEIDKLVN